MTLIRRPDWLPRLHLHFEERRRQRMRWGTNDCAMFACDAILAMTDVDLATEFRGRYDCPFSAIGAIRRFVQWGDLEDVVDVMSRRHGLVEYPKVVQAQRGDVALARTPLGSMLVVVWDHYAYSPRPSRLGRTFLSDCVRAWKI